MRYTPMSSTTFARTAMTILLVFSVLSQAVGAQAVPSIGLYECEGTQNGVAYTMPLKVEPLGETVKLTWGPPSTLIGLGLPHQGYLAVAIVSRSTGAVGVAMYAISACRLTVAWARGDGTIDVENCRTLQQGKPA